MEEEKCIQGTLIPIGGNEDRGEDESENNGLDFIEEGILAHVVRESGGNEARILVIPTASSIPDRVAENYLTAFDKLGCNNVEVLNIKDNKHAEDPTYLKAVEEANCTMFSGGNQSKITAAISGTSMHDLLIKKLTNEDFVIAGTSAGAMAMASEMIAGGSSTEALQKGAVKMNKGLGFVPRLIIDTHFVRRGRFGRMAEAVAAFPNLIGIGLSEDTGLIIKNCNEFRVIGSGMIILFDASQLTHNHHEILDEGTPMSMSNLITHVLSNGDRFNIENKKIEILPLEAEFI